MEQAYHQPVLADEVVEIFRPLTRGVVVDATFGGGGHAERLLASLPEELTLFGLDRDPAALDAFVARRGPERVEVIDEPDGGRTVRSGRVTVTLRNYREMDAVLAEHGIERITGVLFDLGISSRQVDEDGRGFSYHRTGPLDMRMGPDAAHAADVLVNESGLEKLASIIARYGEEHHARRIAAAIVAARPIGDTVELAGVVADAVPAAARRRGHPARRTFQALRIAVNDELQGLVEGLEAGLGHLDAGGRCVVISYHSLEDRIVKRRFVAGSQGCTCPPDLPVCGCGNVAELRRLTRRSIRPSEEEIASNPRSRSARLRAVEKVAA